MTSFADNPLLVKHLRSRMRRQHVLPMVVVVFLICACVLWATWQRGPRAGSEAFRVLLFIGGTLLLLSGTGQVASAVGRAAASGMLDFHRASPLPPRSVALGFLFGAPVREYLGFAIVAAFALLASTQGDPGLAGGLLVLFVLWTSAVLFHTLALVTGLISPRARITGVSLVAVIVFAHMGAGWMFSGIGVPGVLTCLPTVMEVYGVEFDPIVTPEGVREPVHPTFLGITMPLTVQSLLHQAVLIGLLWPAAVRRMRAADAQVYSKRFAVLALAAVAVLALGGAVGHPLLVSRQALHVVLVLVTVPAWILAIVVTPDARLFVAGIRRAKRAERRLGAWEDAAGNRVAVAVLAAVVVAAGAVVAFFEQVDETAWLSIGTAAASVVVFGAALQWSVFRWRRRAVPYFLLFIFCAWIFPLMVAGVLTISSRSSGEAVEVVVGLCPIGGIFAPTHFAFAVHVVTAVVFLGLASSRQAAEETAAAS